MSRRLIVGFIVATSALASIVSVPARASEVGAALAAGIVGAAVGASLADHPHHGHKHKAHFSPEPGIECYDHQRACYHADGGFAKNWTWRVYG